jgi:outer membrane protein TolC
MRWTRMSDSALLRMKISPCRQRSICILLLFCLSCAISGCQGTSKYQAEIKDYSSTFLVPMDAKYFNEQKNHAPSRKGDEPSLSVQQAALLAAEKDEEALAILAELKKAKIDVIDAVSHRWPRLDFQTQADLPVNADNNQKVDYTGGAYIKYDIWRAVAVDDEYAMRQAFVKRELERLKIVLNGMLKKILHQLSQISFLEYKIEKKNDSLVKAKTAYEVAKVYAQNNQVDGSLVQSWKSRIDSLGFDLKKSEQELRVVNHSLAHMAGLPDDDDVDITDRQEVLASSSSISDQVPAPSEIWSRHSEARLVEVEYIAAEVNVKLAHMEGWPRLQTSFGLGNVPLAGNGDTTGTLLQLSVDLPLWDGGDNERKVAKAEITRDFVKSRLSKKASDLSNRAKEASYMFHTARENYRDLDDSFIEKNEQLQNESILLAENRLNTLEQTLAQLNVIDADILRQDALAKMQEAGGNFRFSIGEDVIKDMVPILLETILHQHMILDETRTSREENTKKDIVDTRENEVQ